MNYDNVASEESVKKTAAALSERGFETMIVNTKEEALEKVKSLIPPGSTVTNGTSATLREIGYIEYLKEGTHGWNNLQEKVIAETDMAKQGLLRKQASVADYYLGSVHAVAETGELLIASASGSQLSAIVFNATNVIFVVSTSKITSSIDGSLKRLREHVFPQENERMKTVGFPGSVISKILIYEREPKFGRTVKVLLVNEKLGF